MNVDQFFYIIQAAHLVPIALAATRYKKIDHSYRPFILLLIIGLVNETINYLSIKLFNSNAVSFNFFHIVECLLLFYQFRVWSFFKNKRVYNVFVAGAIIAWLIENFLYSGITIFNPYFRIFYAFVIELIIANRIVYVVSEKTRIIKNSKFIICVGLIIVFMYQIIFEGALLADPALSEPYSKMIIKSMGFTDVFIQLIFGWALLVAPIKRSNFFKAPDYIISQHKDFNDHV